MSSYVIVCRRTDQPKVRPWFEYLDVKDAEENGQEAIVRDIGDGWPPKNERYQDRAAAEKAAAKLRKHMLPIYEFEAVPRTKGMRRELRVGVRF